MFFGAEPGPPPSTWLKYIDTTYFAVGYGDVNSLAHGSLGTERIIDGQTVQNGSFIEKTVIQTSNLVTGVYLIKPQYSNTFEVKKLIKE